MRILIDIGHPAHVHFYKHIIWRLQEKGHQVLLAARDKDVTLALLDHYSLPHRILSTTGDGRLGLVKEFLQREWGLMRVIRDFDPDVVTAIGGVFISPITKLLGKVSVVFTDTEHVALDRYLTYPLASAIVTPECFLRDLGKGQIRYRGFQELAYLHPGRFQPDERIVRSAGISLEEPYIVLRLVSWSATHDRGHSGLPRSAYLQITERLSHFGRVYISSETALPPEVEPYRLPVPPHHMHHVLALARLYFGEGATMATEAGLLGTPSVYVSSLVGSMGNFEQLMQRYKLAYAYRTFQEGYQVALNLLEQGEGIKAIWKRRRDEMLERSVDVVEVACDLLEKSACAA